MKMIQPVQGGDFYAPEQLRALIESDLGMTQLGDRASFRREYVRDSATVATLDLHMGDAGNGLIVRWIDLSTKGVPDERMSEFFRVIKNDLSDYNSRAEIRGAALGDDEVPAPGPNKSFRISNGMRHQMKASEAASLFQTMDTILSARLKGATAKDTLNRNGQRANPDVTF